MVEWGAIRFFLNSLSCLWEQNRLSENSHEAKEVLR